MAHASALCTLRWLTEKRIMLYRITAITIPAFGRFGLYTDIEGRLAFSRLHRRQRKITVFAVNYRQQQHHDGKQPAAALTHISRHVHSLMMMIDDNGSGHRRPEADRAP